MIPISKGHAYGNDFLLAPRADVRSAGADDGVLARAMCHRHEGVGADGLILYELRDDGAAMTLFNADGSPSELSGNGLRCLAALVARTRRLSAGDTVAVDTGAGRKTNEISACSPRATVTIVPLASCAKQSVGQSMPFQICPK